MERLLQGLRAAAEDTRLRVLALCSETELSVSELTQILGQSQPRVSRHLKLMVEAGLLERFREGAWAFYRVAETGANAALAKVLLELTPNDDTGRARDRSRLDTVRRDRAFRAEEFFKRNAQDWDEIRRMHVDDESIERSLRVMLPAQPGWSHVDIGTGTGRILEIVAPMTKRAIGIDLSHEMLTVARSNLARAGVKNCHLRYGDMRQLELQPESFDVATFHLVLHYADDPALVLAEAARLLRPGGSIVVIDFAPHEESILVLEHAHRWLGFTDAKMEIWFRRAGLEPVKTVHLSGHPLTVCLWSAKLTEMRTEQFNMTEKGSRSWL
jgi:ubiquinone/menaquinone biosynthesis C-methylase UbiE/DNA-binding transcriptional ArsR family regulator